ncbi:MAG: hypothetical protein H0W83_09350 [Planctomycetes bacterium]|nr:hypothetical protein [Planctomycetota bacterium]
MRPLRHDLSLLSATLVSLTLVACGHRDAPAPVAEAASDDVPSATLSRPSVPTIAVEDPAATTAVDSTPVIVRLDDRPEGFWAVKSSEIANAAASEGAYPAAPETTAAPARAKSDKTDKTDKESKPEPVWRTVDAGALQVPHTVRPGRLIMNGPTQKGAEAEPQFEFPLAATHECFLLKVPMTYVAAAGFDKPLTRVDVTLVLGDVVGEMAAPSPGNQPAAPQKSGKKRSLSGLWQIQDINAVGFSGLRFGPNPMPDGPEQFYFLSERLLGRLNDTRPINASYWRVDANAARAIPGEIDVFALLVVPKKSRQGVATLQAKMWFTPGNEATVVLPAQTLQISFDPLVEPPVAKGR